MQDSLNPGLAVSQSESLNRSVRSMEARLHGFNAATDGRKKEELRRAAEEFESLFVAQLLKVMRETIEEASSPEGGGFGKTIYTELFDQEMSRTIAKRGSLGIADLLMRSFRDDAIAGTAGPKPLPAAGGAAEDTVPPPGMRAVPPGNPVPSTRPVSEDPDEIPDTMMPVNAPVSSGFGLRPDPFTRQLRFHKGLDLAAPAGTPVHAAAGGEVTFAGYQRGYGNSIVIRHADGLETRYAHLGTMSVKAGEPVKADQLIAEVGDTGRSTGAHLHFEVTRWGNAVDPGAAVQSRAALGE